MVDHYVSGRFSVRRRSRAARTEHTRTLRMIDAARRVSRARAPCYEGESRANRRECEYDNTSYIQCRPPNDCRINCNAARRGDGETRRAGCAEM